MRVKSKIAVVLMMCASIVAANPQKTIAFAQDTMANDFRKAQVYEVREALAHNPDIRFRATDAKGKTALLISHINQLIDAKTDIIIVGTNDEKAVVPVVAKAYQKGIAVIVLDRGIQGREYTTFINSDNIKIGSLGAQYIAKRLNGKGKVRIEISIQKG